MLAKIEEVFFFRNNEVTYKTLKDAGCGAQRFSRFKVDNEYFDDFAAALEFRAEKAVIQCLNVMKQKYAHKSNIEALDPELMAHMMRENIPMFMEALKETAQGQADLEKWNTPGPR